MMAINSKKKGAEGERELSRKLREYGYDCRRSAQYCGANGDAQKLDAVGQAIDLVLDELEGRISGNDYQQAAMRTAAEKDPVRLLQNGVLGLAGESGEVADHLKKHLFQGHELSRKHVAEELGDICWYVAVSAYAIGYDLEEVFRINVNKLMQRYPNGFEKERSLNREPKGV